MPALAESGALLNMPIREVTVFKDGTAFLRQEGTMATGVAGDVTIGNLRTPLLGTFWPYSAEPKARLVSVLSKRETIQRSRSASTLYDIARANIGKRVVIGDGSGRSFTATIVGFPGTRPPDAPIDSEITPPDQGPRLIILRTLTGDQVLNFDRLQEITFPDGRVETIDKPETRHSLTLRLGWAGGKSDPAAKVGMISLQQGLSWTPSYKVVIDGNGNATIKLQATLSNELADLDNVDVNLVIGVPTFAFKDTVDPVALQQATEALIGNVNGSMRRSFSNAIQSQVAGLPLAEADYSGGGGAQATPSATKSEDLFVFGLKNITVHKGERLVVPVAEFAITYRDIYALDIPIAPPVQTLDNLSTEQRAIIGASLMRSTVMHKLRLKNSSEFPLTTAPALIMSGDRVIAQGLMKYTPVGKDGDLDLTTAVDVVVKFKDKETSRSPNTERFGDYTYSRVSLAGNVHIANASGKPIMLEVNRFVAGTVDSASGDGAVEQSGPFAEEAFLGASGSGWLRYINWPGWWYQQNSIGKASWTVSLPKGESADLAYTWHYYWR
jgi:hypothetical protein